MRVYRKVLTAAEITADMAKPVVTGAPPAPGPERFGQFTPPQTWPLVPVHMATLSNGKIVVFDGFDAALNSERIWDPVTNTFTPVPTGRNLFCAGHVTLPDGRLFVAGGHIAANEGTKNTTIFNPTTRELVLRHRHGAGALVPDGHHAPRRAHPRGVGRQHHAQRAGPRRAAQERLGDAAGDLQRRHATRGRR